METKKTTDIGLAAYFKINNFKVVVNELKLKNNKKIYNFVIEGEDLEIIKDKYFEDKDNFLSFKHALSDLKAQTKNNWRER